MSRDVNALYQVHTTLTEVVAGRSEKSLLLQQMYTDEYNRQLRTMVLANAFDLSYDINQPLRITLPNTVSQIQSPYAE